MPSHELSVFQYIKTSFSLAALFNYPIPAVFCIASPLQDICHYASSLTNVSADPYAILRYAMNNYYNASGQIITGCFPYPSKSVLPTGCTKPHHDNILLGDDDDYNTVGLSPYGRHPGWPAPSPLMTNDNEVDINHDDDGGGPYYNPWAYQSCSQFIYGGSGGVGIFADGYNFDRMFICHSWH
eukprot:TRINITY_DN25402_c0_g1_i1.p1 TRINITY_DN25402_c0_g1~~TRINITY_DN25402_c0_g1_i1.p1  ORF type:complete len:199 (-),score=22.19 TRINITY_DN25402_c0_g1_i1:108-656(-)